MTPIESIIKASRDSKSKNNGDIALIVLNGFEKIKEELLNEIEKICKKSGQKVSLIDFDQVRFSNGEGKIKLNNSVRAKDVYILVDTGNYSCTYKMFGFENHFGPDEHFQDLKRAICALGGRANRITVVMPLLYSGRQHRRKGRESLDCAMALQDLQRLGVDSIITFDAHDANVQNAIPLCSFDNIFPSYYILKDFIKNEKIGYKKGDIIVIAPDAGAMDRAIFHANILGQDVGMFYKRRDFTKVVNGKNPILQHEYMGQDVKDKSIIVVDDMIASGESVLDIAKNVKERGAKNVYVISPYAMFTEGINKFEEYFAKGYLTKIYTTNLSYIPEEIKTKKWINVSDLVPFVAQIIATINGDHSISPLIELTKELSAEIGKK